LSEQPGPSGVIQTDDGEIIPPYDPQKLADDLQKMREMIPPQPTPGAEVPPPPFSPPSPATGAPGVARCFLPGSFPVEPPPATRLDLPIPGAVTSPISEEECRILGLKDEDCPPRWPDWLKREKGIPE